MKVAIFFAVYKRLPILKICLEGIERLKKDHKDIEFIPFAVYSNLNEKKMLERYGVRSLKADNEYLGRKKNAGLKSLLKLEWDYLMEIGSDDLINSKLIDVYKPMWEEGVDCFGVNSCYFIEASTGRVAYWKHDYAIGAGRCIKRDVFDVLGKRVRVRFKSSIPGYGKGSEEVYIRKVADSFTDYGVAEVVCEENDPFGLWTDTKNIALDGDSQHRLGMNGFKVIPLDVDGVMVIDIKSGQNIHKFQAFNECDKGFKEVLKDFSSKERDGIWKLR